MKCWVALAAGAAFFGIVHWGWSAEKAKYPEPRFPSYLKPPKSVEEMIPFARAIARQAAGFGGQGFGALKEGETAALITEATAEDMVIEALRKAVEERCEGPGGSRLRAGGDQSQ
jgi:hypothetical protein